MNMEIVQKIVEETLQEEMWELKDMGMFRIEEYFYSKSRTFVSGDALFKNANDEIKIGIEHHGEGVVDAIFSASVYILHESGFHSIRDYDIIDYNVSLATYAGSESQVTTEVTFLNLRESELLFRFEDQNSSVVAASIKVILDSLCFLINVEDTIKKLDDAIDYAKKKHRHDLVEKYTAKMSEIVNINSYHDVLKNHRIKRNKNG